MYCKSCGAEMNENQEICLSCGVKKGSGNSFCANCGKEISPNADVCLNCGVKVSNANVNSDDLAGKDKTTAGILALLLGGFGVHNFYLGESKKGVVKILLCWTGISSILALIDAIKIFTDKYEADSTKFF